MPATNGVYSNNEYIIYNALINDGYNTAAACGILANLYEESKFDSHNVQDSYEHLVGSDMSYTSGVDNGFISKSSFIYDQAGYGIAQWTYFSRKQALYDFRGSNSIGNLNMQINFMLYELKNSYSTVGQTLRKLSNNADAAYRAGEIFHRLYEKSTGGSTVSARRAKLARDTFWAHYDNSESSQAVSNKGTTIVEYARSCIGTEYRKGGEKTEENPGLDDAGLVYYSYKGAGVPIPRGTASSYYNTYKDSRKVAKSEASAGDLLFYTDSSPSTTIDYTLISYVAIANGRGGRIYTNSTTKKVVEEDGLGNPSYILRILADSETTQNGSYSGSSGSGVDDSDSMSPESYLSLTSTDPYSMQISDNLSNAHADGYDYGYLIDMTHGGEFKFYVPEFSEQAGARWSNIEIRGRSVDVLAYEGTTSRSITVSLDLYAGVGLYKANSGEDGIDTVDRLHKDAYFVKSLEYPDYTNAITRPPAVVHLILGAAINISGVVSGVTVEHLKPLDQYNRAMYLKLSFTVTQIATNPIDYTDVLKGQYTLASTSNVGSMENGSTKDTSGPLNTLRGE